MKTIKIIKYLFLILGIGLLTGSLLIYRSTSSFLAEATHAEGTVVKLMESHSDNSTTYRPVVCFSDLNGNETVFVSSTGSYPPSYTKGEKVDVLYPKNRPQNAIINSFFSIWGGTVIIGGLGGVFFLISASMFLVPALKTRKGANLKDQGVSVEAEFVGVELNTGFSVNGQSPFRIVTQWINPSTSELHVFRSEDIWFDPTTYMTNKHIRVYIERDNPKKYFVDLSFLPKIAE